MLGERIARRSHSYHQDVLAVVTKRIRPPGVDWVPSRQQRDNLEAVWQSQHIGENAGFDLRYVHRILLLKNARLHAVIADAVTRAGQHRIVDHYYCKRADRMALSIKSNHLRDLRIERAAFEQDVERIAIDGTVFLVHPRGTGVLPTFVT